MDEHGSSQNMDVGRECADKSSLNWPPIQSCTEGDLGRKLEIMYANMTASLNPPHDQVPWITINGMVRERRREKLGLFLNVVP